MLSGYKSPTEGTGRPFWGLGICVRLSSQVLSLARLASALFALPEFDVAQVGHDGQADTHDDGPGEDFQHLLHGLRPQVQVFE